MTVESRPGASDPPRDDALERLRRTAFGRPTTASETADAVAALEQLARLEAPGTAEPAADEPGPAGGTTAAGGDAPAGATAATEATGAVSVVSGVSVTSPAGTPGAAPTRAARTGTRIRSFLRRRWVRWTAAALLVALAFGGGTLFGYSGNVRVYRSVDLQTQPFPSVQSSSAADTAAARERSRFGNGDSTLSAASDLRLAESWFSARQTAADRTNLSVLPVTAPASTRLAADLRSRGRAWVAHGGSGTGTYCLIVQGKVVDDRLPSSVVCAAAPDFALSGVTASAGGLTVRWVGSRVTTSVSSAG